MGLSNFRFSTSFLRYFDKFTWPFKSNLGEDAVYNFARSMIKESKYYTDVMKKHLNKEPVITKIMKTFKRY